MTLVGVIYYLQAAGPSSKGEKYVQPWMLLALRPAERLRSETVYFPYVPLTSTARFQHVLERSKLEFVVSGRFRFGPGYGAYQRRGAEWQHRPFVTATFTPPKLGDIELWLQRVPGGGAQVQVRYLQVLR